MTYIIKITVLLILLAWCFFIIQPFILVVLWATILAVALFPVYSYFVKKTGVGKKKLVSVLFAIVVSGILLVPAYVGTKSAVESTLNTANKIKTNSLQIPAPNERVKEWPLIGEKLYANWLNASLDIKHYSVVHKEVILEQGARLLSGVKGFIGAFITFFLALMIAIIFMHNSEASTTAILRLFSKLLGGDGEEIVYISRDVMRSVVKGILLVAIIQAGLAFIGFKAIDLPAAGIFTFLILVVSIVQIPAIIVMIPAIILAFSISDTTPAIIFTIYCILVGLSDNVLKPILLGKGLKTPMMVILIGTIGGMLLHGIIGLFIGAVILAVMYRMYQFWVNVPTKPSLDN